jgi:hypothetical protein
VLVTDDKAVVRVDSGAMYARAVDEAASRLRELRMEEWQDLGLGALSFGSAVAATQLAPAFGMPFFLGGLFLLFRGMRTLVRRFDLVEQLAVDRDAYVMAEVRRRALRDATLERRRTMACYLRRWLGEPRDVRATPAADELAMLVAELEDDTLELEPACAVACARLLSDPQSSPLLNEALPADEIRSRVLRIRAGFRPVPAALEGHIAPGTSASHAR